MDPVTFTTSDGVGLEGELRMPDAAPRGSAVICHPHPRHGGSKDHPILWALRNELAGQRGLATLSFNFRGVMGSHGTYGGGHAETHDVRAALDLVRSNVPDLPSIVCGWSFGANVALREAFHDDRVGGLVLVGLPLRPGDLALPTLPTASELASFRRPVLLMAGTDDEYCPSDELSAYGARLPRGEVTLIEGTDHYLWRHEREMAALAGAFVDRVIEVGA